MINLNGQILPTDTPVFTRQNRAFRYGDGLFESMRQSDHQVLLLPYHLDRLLAGARTLGLSLPPTCDQAFFAREIQKLTGGQANARIRLTLFRSEGGFYHPLDNTAHFLIESEATSSPGFPSPDRGLQVGFYQDFPAPALPFKSLSALTYVLAAHAAADLDDLLLSNKAGAIIESSSSNVFLWKNGSLSTPDLSQEGVRGVMRRAIFQIARHLHIPVQERQVSQAELAQAEHIWLTNAVQGIRWVEKLGEGHYSPGPIDTFIQQLNHPEWSL